LTCNTIEVVISSYLKDFSIVFFVVLRNNAFLYLFDFDIDNNRDDNASNNEDNIDNIGDIIEAIHNVAKEGK